MCPCDNTRQNIYYTSLREKLPSCSPGFGYFTFLSIMLKNIPIFIIRMRKNEFGVTCL